MKPWAALMCRPYQYLSWELDLSRPPPPVPPCISPEWAKELSHALSASFCVCVLFVRARGVEKGSSWWPAGGHGLSDRTLNWKKRWISHSPHSRAGWRDLLAFLKERRNPAKCCHSWGASELGLKCLPVSMPEEVTKLSKTLFTDWATEAGSEKLRDLFSGTQLQGGAGTRMQVCLKIEATGGQQKGRQLLHP